MLIDIYLHSSWPHVGSPTTVKTNQRRFAPTPCPHHWNPVPTSPEWALCQSLGAREAIDSNNVARHCPFKKQTQNRLLQVVSHIELLRPIIAYVPGAQTNLTLHSTSFGMSRGNHQKAN